MDLFKLKMKDLSPNKVITIFSLRNILEGTKTKERELERIGRIGKKTLRNSLNKFVEKFNSMNSARLDNPLIMKVPKNDAFLIQFSIMSPSFTKKKVKFKRNEQNSSKGSYFCLYLMKKDKKLKYFRGNKNVLSWVNWWLSSKSSENPYDIL